LLDGPGNRHPAPGPRGRRAKSAEPASWVLPQQRPAAQALDECLGGGADALAEGSGTRQEAGGPTPSCIGPPMAPTAQRRRHAASQATHHQDPTASSGLQGGAILPLASRGISQNSRYLRRNPTQRGPTVATRPWPRGQSPSRRGLERAGRRSVLCLPALDARETRQGYTGHRSVTRSTPFLSVHGLRLGGDPARGGRTVGWEGRQSGERPSHGRARRSAQCVGGGAGVVAHRRLRVWGPLSARVCNPSDAPGRRRSPAR
jgi:hypothetical protein